MGEGVQFTSLRSIHAKGHYSAEMSLLCVYAPWYLALMCLCVPEGSVGKLGSVCTCLCVGEYRHMYVVWGTCELEPTLLYEGKGTCCDPAIFLFSSPSSS